MTEKPQAAQKDESEDRNTGDNSPVEQDAGEDRVEKVVAGYRQNVFSSWAVTLKLCTPKQVEDALAEFEAKERRGEKTTLREFFHRIGLRKENMELLFSIKAYMELLEQDKKFGNIAVRNGFVSREVVDSTLALQRKQFAETRSSAKLGDMLVANGDMTEEQKSLVLIVQKRRDPSIYKVIRTVRKNEKDMEKKLDGLLDVMITGDKLTAHIILNYRVDAIFSTAHIKNWLFGKGIKYGVYNSMIDTFLKEMTPGKKYRVAEGQHPVPGKDAAMVYHFQVPDEEEGGGKQGAGDSLEGGNIAFVKKGDLLAEKMPAEEGKPGITVFGQYCAPTSVKDVHIWSGKGVLSDDMLRFYAEEDGFPKLSGKTTLTVEPEFRLYGDLDRKAGSMDLGVNVNVSGTIKSGVRIRCHNLMAGAIEGAFIQATGDVIVKNTINGAHIKAVGNVVAGKEITDAEIRDHGNVTARALKGVRLHAFGDVNVTKEIVESELMISGSCTVKSGGLIPKGKILASKISAREGIRAVDIGMTGTPANELSVGMDFNMDERVASLKEKMAAASKVKREFDNRKQAITAKLSAVETKIEQLEKVRAGVESEFASCEERIEGAREKGDNEMLAVLEDLQCELETKSKASVEALQSYYSFRKKAKQELVEFGRQNRENDEKIGKIIGRIKGCSLRSGGKSVVDVSGMVYETTAVNGVHGGITIDKRLSNVKIEELEVGDSQWKMVAVKR